jgi:hypothetical protein
MELPVALLSSLRELSYPNKKSPLWRLIVLLLRLLKHYVLAQFLGIFLKLDLAGDELFVLRSPVDFASFFVLELDEIVLCFCHSHKIVPYFNENCKVWPSLSS